MKDSKFSDRGGKVKDYPLYVHKSLQRSAIRDGLYYNMQSGYTMGMNKINIEVRV